MLYFLSGAFTDDQLTNWATNMKIRTEIDLGIDPDIYGETLKDLVLEEFDRAVKREVTALVSATVKKEVDKLRDHLTEQMRVLTPKKLDEYLVELSRGKK